MLTSAAVPVLEVAILNVRPAECSAFETAFREASNIISSMPGYCSHELRRCVEASNRYILLVQWRRLEDHTVGFRQSAQYQHWRSLLHHFYDPFPTVEHYGPALGELASMATIDHIILKVNDLAASIAFYSGVLGFTLQGMDGPFTVLRAGPDLQLQLAPWGTRGAEHYAFAVSKLEFESIFDRIKAAGIDYGPTFDSVGANSQPGNESGARGFGPTVYFNDPNKHLLEIRTYEL